MKARINITLDQDVYERHRVAGTNISALCNDFLGAYLDKGGQKMLDLHKEAFEQAKTVVDVVVDKQKQDDDLKKYLSYARKVRSNSPEKFGPVIDLICKRFGLERVIVVHKLDSPWE